MNQPDNRPAGVPRPGVPGGAPRPGIPGGVPRSATDRPAEDADGLLGGVEDDLRSLDQLDPQDQVAVFDRIHSTLAEALARTADTGGPSAGQQGA